MGEQWFLTIVVSNISMSIFNIFKKRVNAVEDDSSPKTEVPAKEEIQERQMTEKEKEEKIEFLAKREAHKSFPSLFESSSDIIDLDLSIRDSLFEEVARIVVENQSGSTSLIQRRFSIGYNRAGKITDQLEAAGIISQSVGSQARQVMIKDLKELEKLFENIDLKSVDDDFLTNNKNEIKQRATAIIENRKSVREAQITKENNDKIIDYYAKRKAYILAPHLFNWRVHILGLDRLMQFTIENKLILSRNTFRKHQHISTDERYRDAILQLESARIAGIPINIEPMDVIYKSESELDEILADLENFSINFSLNYQDEILKRRDAIIENREQAEIRLLRQEEEREKEEIKQRILEKQKRRNLEKQVLQELINEGEIFPEANKRPPIPRELVNAVWNRDGGKCVYCGSNKNIHIDHIIPFSKGGATTLENLQMLCQKCNLEKSDKIG